MANLVPTPTGVQFGTVQIKMGRFVPDSAADDDTDPDLAPVGGVVKFQPTVDYVLTGDGRSIHSSIITGEIDETGELTMSLVATDSPGLDPTGWAYKMTLIPNGGSAITRTVQIKAGEVHDLKALLGAAQPGVATTAPTVEWDGTVLVVGGVRGPDFAGSAGSGSGVSEEAVKSIVEQLLPEQTEWTYLNDSIPDAQEGDWLRARRSGEWVAVQAYFTPREWPAEFSFPLPAEWQIMNTVTACGVDGGAPVGPIASVGESITIWGAPTSTSLSLGAANFRNGAS